MCNINTPIQESCFFPFEKKAIRYLGGRVEPQKLEFGALQIGFEFVCERVGVFNKILVFP